MGETRRSWPTHTFSRQTRLHAVDPGGQDVGDRRRAVCVDSDRQAVAVRLVDRPAQDGGVELGQMLMRARGQGATADHDLDDVDPVLDVFAHRPAHPVLSRFRDPPR